MGFVNKFKGVTFSVRALFIPVMLGEYSIITTAEVFAAGIAIEKVHFQIETRYSFGQYTQLS
jgi:hypothetical protein